MQSFSPFDETVFLLPLFKNNMFCHHGARYRSKHDVKIKHAQFIDIPHLYIALSLLCLSPYNLKWHWTTWHLICTHLFDNHKLVLQIFHFLTVYLLVHSSDNPERRLTLLIFWPNIYRYFTLFRTVLYSKYNYHQPEKIYYS